MPFFKAILLSIFACTIFSCDEYSSRKESGSFGAAFTPIQERQCTTQVSEEGDHIKYCGNLGEAALEFFLQNTSNHTKSITLTSVSSDQDYAIAIADHIAQFDVEVIIEEACLFGCAQFIFMSSKRVTTLPQSIVAFSHTSSALDFLANRDDWPEAVRYREDSEIKAAQERAFYSRHEIDDRWLIEPYIRMQHECLVEEINWSTRPSPTIYTKRHYGFWIPDRQLIEEYTNITLSGYWPRFEQGEQNEDLSWIVRLGRKHRLKNGLSVGGNDRFFDDRYDELLGRLRFCSADDL